MGRCEIASVENPVSRLPTSNSHCTRRGIGLSLSEVVLIDADGVFAAVKNVLPKGKDGDVKFTFEFDDEF